MATFNTSPLDVLVIGAGQAGLATGYHLTRTGLRFALLDSHARLGDSWRQRFDSLTLFTPRSYSALPSLAVPGDPGGYPTKDEIADYLEAYAAHFAMPIRSGVTVRSLEASGANFSVTTSDGAPIESRSVVIAWGHFRHRRSRPSQPSSRPVSISCRPAPTGGQLICQPERCSSLAMAQRGDRSPSNSPPPIESCCRQAAQGV